MVVVVAGCRRAPLAPRARSRRPVPAVPRVARGSPARRSTFHELKGHKKRVSCVNVNTSGNALLTGSWDEELAVWA